MCTLVENPAVFSTLNSETKSNKICLTQDAMLFRGEGERLLVSEIPGRTSGVGGGSTCHLVSSTEERLAV